MYPRLLWQNGSVQFSTSSCVRRTQFCRWSHQLSGDKCNNAWVSVGEDSHAEWGVSSRAAPLRGFVSLEGGCRGPRKFILEFPVWETSPLLRHPSWLVVLGDFCLIRNRHHMRVITYHRTQQKQTELKKHQKNNIHGVSGGTSSSRLINRD